MIKNLADGASLDEISTVLFDMDGTLVDHFETIFRCYEFAAQATGKVSPDLRRSKTSSWWLYARNNQGLL